MTQGLDTSARPPSRDLAEFSIALVAGLGLAVTALFLFAVPFAGHMAGSRDFVSYWATGRQLVHHANPYDRDAISAIEHGAGLDARGILIMRNPPWALPLAYPLGYLGLRVAAILWSLLLLGCLLVSVVIVRRLHGSPPNHMHWLGLAFTPALICLTMGQTSLLGLLGLALFLRYHAHRPFAAGLALWLCMLKPHLFLPFAAVLAAWIVFARVWRILAGAAAALAITSALAFVIAPRAWADYAAMLRSPLLENEFIPCLADALRHWFWPQIPAARFLLAVPACLWALGYFWRRRHDWNWTRHASPLMLVALLTAPYCFLYDQCLAVPALMDAAYRTRRRPLIPALAALLLVLDAQLAGVRIVSAWYLWTAPAWCAWYFLATRNQTDAAS
jgi:Glycosyltransferase family 87